MCVTQLCYFPYCGGLELNSQVCLVLPISEIAELYCSSIFSCFFFFFFLRHHHTVLHSGCTNLHYYQQCIGAPFILYIFLVISDIEHIFMYQLTMWLSSIEKWSKGLMLLFKLDSFFLSFFGIELYGFLIYFWRREWQPTPVSLPEESHRQRSLAG